MGQVKTAKKILDQEGEYLFALKGNQKYLEERVKNKFNLRSSKKGPKPTTIDVFKSKGEEHERIETRICKVITAKEKGKLEINPNNKWPELNSIIEITSSRVDKTTGEIGEEVRYYISSCFASAEKFSKLVRGHWEIENKLHWVLDVVFREDECRSRVGHSAENFSVLRQFALNLIKKESSQKAIRRKQNIASWDESFLLKILIGTGI